LAEYAVRRIADAFGRFSSAWTYTHHDPFLGDNARILEEATRSGLTCNLSADSLAQADAYRETGLPTVVTVDENYPRASKSPGGNVVVVCPEQTGHTASCATCPRGGWCAIPDRDFIVAFRAHGARRSSISPQPRNRGPPGGGA
jgi:hypothetical protein